MTAAEGQHAPRAVGDAGRVLRRLEQLWRLGPEPHASRAGLGAAEQAAVDLVAGWMREAGLAVSVDAAGNLFGRLPGREPGLAEVWTGSHLDTVPAGGRFDGALGVVAGLEAAARLAAGARPRRTVAVVAFRDEEGWRFGQGCFGSRALCGRLDPGELDERDPDGVSRREALGALGLGAPPAAGWLDPAPDAFLELHVEQGPALAAAAAPLGVVTAIAGMAGFDVVFTGVPAHAGTTPMRERADAACAAAVFVLAVRDAALALPGAVATVGAIALSPGAANVVPGRAALSLDTRAPDAATLDRLTAAVEPAARSAAEATACEAEVVARWRSAPQPMATQPAAALTRALERRGRGDVRLPSGAGHDAGVLAAAGVPAAMLLARSLRDGVSHAPEEHTDGEAVALAVDVLAGALGELAG